MNRMYKHILLAVDGSENSNRAALETLKFVRSQTKITIVVVYEEDQQLTEEDKQSIIQPVVNVFNQVNMKYNVLELIGEPGPSILEESEKGDYDIIVIGSRGLSGVQEMVLGSVSHKVAKRAHIPVLIVK